MLEILNLAQNASKTISYKTEFKCNLFKTLHGAICKAQQSKTSVPEHDEKYPICVFTQKTA